jgi:phospholipid-binding lipoprotein MlaA
MSAFRRFAVLSFLMFGTLAITACADMPTSPQEKAEVETANDPFEPVNRVIFDVNDFLDRLLIRPLAELYRAMIPPGVRDRVTDILSNMREPVIFANNLMQGQFTRASVTAERFAINTTIGVGGMFDWANDWKLYQQTGDFGQTLHSWGVGSGPYLVLPLLGPSNIRDAIGLGVDSVMTPWQYLARNGSSETYWDFQYVDNGMDGITKREENIEGVDALRQGSLDFYAQMRSVYRQYRDKQLGIKGTTGNVRFEDYEEDGTGSMSDPEQPTPAPHKKHHKKPAATTTAPQSQPASQPPSQ